MKQQYIFFIISLFYLISGFAQNPYADIQQYPKETIAKNRVHKIIAWEYTQDDEIILDTTVIKPFQQSVEIFDSLGRLVSKQNFWAYSDEEAVKRMFTYDSFHNIVKYEEYTGNELMIQESFTYDAQQNMKTWTADLVKKRQKHFEETIMYDSLNNPVQISVVLGKKEVAHQYIDYVYNAYQKPIVEVCRDEKKQLVDSVFYKYPKNSDTLYIKHIYETDKKNLVRIQSYVNRVDGAELYRNEEYAENKFLGVTYHFFDKQKGLIKERSIHHYPQLNFTKDYIYDKSNVIKQKIVYKNTEKPVSIIKYEIIYFGQEEK